MRRSPFFGSRFLDTLFRQAGPVARDEFAALAVERYASQRDLFRRFYDFDVVGSIEARAVWMPPTLEEIEDSAATHLDIATQ